MSVRNANLGGTDVIAGEKIKSADWNDTFNAIYSNLIKIGTVSNTDSNLVAPSTGVLKTYTVPATAQRIYIMAAVGSYGFSSSGSVTPATIVLKVGGTTISTAKFQQIYTGGDLHSEYGIAKGSDTFFYVDETTDFSSGTVTVDIECTVAGTTSLITAHCGDFMVLYTE